MLGRAANVKEPRILGLGWDWAWIGGVRGMTLARSHPRENGTRRQGTLVQDMGTSEIGIVPASIGVQCPLALPACWLGGVVASLLLSVDAEVCMQPLWLGGEEDRSNVQTVVVEEP